MTIDAPFVLFVFAILSSTASSQGEALQSRESSSPNERTCAGERYRPSFHVVKDKDQNIYAEFTIGGGKCNFYAEVELRKPGRNDMPAAAKSSPTGKYSPGSATARTESIPMGFEDGVYYAEARWSVQDLSDPNSPQYFPNKETDPVDPAKLAMMPVSDVVSGYVQLLSAEWIPDSVARSNPTSVDFVVQVVATRHCTSKFGATAIRATLGGYPVGMHGTFNAKGDHKSAVVLPAGIPTPGVPAKVMFHLDFTAPGPGEIFAFSEVTSTIPEHCAPSPGNPQVAATLNVQ